MEFLPIGVQSDSGRSIAIGSYPFDRNMPSAYGNEMFRKKIILFASLFHFVIDSWLGLS